MSVCKKLESRLYFSTRVSEFMEIYDKSEKPAKRLCPMCDYEFAPDEYKSHLNNCSYMWILTLETSSLPSVNRKQVMWNQNEFERSITSSKLSLGKTSVRVSEFFLVFGIFLPEWIFSWWLFGHPKLVKLGSNKGYGRKCQLCRNNWRSCCVCLLSKWGGWGNRC